MAAGVVAFLHKTFDLMFPSLFALLIVEMHCANNVGNSEADLNTTPGIVRKKCFHDQGIKYTYLIRI